MGHGYARAIWAPATGRASSAGRAVGTAVTSAIEQLEARVLLSVPAGGGSNAAERAGLLAFLKTAPALKQIVGGDPAGLLSKGARPETWRGRRVLALGGQWVVRLPNAPGNGAPGLETARRRLRDFGVQASARLKTAAARHLSQLRFSRALGNGYFLLEGPPTLGQADVAGILKGLPGAESAEPNSLVWADGFAPSDPSYGQLWGLNNTGQGGGKVDADIDAPEGWGVSSGSSSTVVGIIDTGIDYNHPDLAANIWTNPGEVPNDGIDNDGNGYVDDVRGWDFANNDSDPMDDNRHGTHVAGTIGAVGGNGIGVVGVSPNVKMMALKFLAADGTGTTANAIAAVNYATKMRRDFGVNVRLTNNSWGGGGYSQALHDAIAAGAAQDMLFVAAAGNDSLNTDTSVSYPAGYDLDNVVSVASIDRYDNLSAFSNYGKVSVDLAAPGSDIYSTLPNGAYGSLSGTSMATPHVTGALAVLQSAQPGLTAAQMKQRLLQRVEQTAALKDKVATGGRLNLFDLLDPNYTPAPANPDLSGVALTDAGGNNDHLANPGEAVTLTPSFFNGGQLAATGVTVDIVPPAGQATIVGATRQSIADIAPAATAAPPLAFQVQLGSALTDGTKLTFQFVLRYNGTLSKTFSYVLTISKPNPQSQVKPGFAVGEMLADPKRNLVYLLDTTNKKVVAVDTDLGRTVAHADVIGVPTGLAISVDGTELYVSSAAANKIQAFSLPDLFLLRTLDLPTPGRMAAGVGNKLYVQGTGQSTPVRQVDALTGEVRATFGSYYSALPRANAAGTRLFVSEVGLSTTGTDEYDVPSPTGAPVLKKSWSTNMQNGRDLAIDEQYNRLYSMSGGIYGVYAVDMATGTGKTWSFGGAAYGAGVAVNASVPYVYAASQDSYSGGVFKYDRATGTLLGSTKPTGTYKTVWEVEVTGNGNVLYKADPTYSLNPASYEIGIIGRPSLVIASVPNARFVASQPVVTPGLTVSFDGTPSKDYEATGTIVGWSWDFGDSTTATGSKVDHTFATPGTYTVKLTVTDAQGYTDDFVTQVKVSDPPAADPVAVTTDEDTPATVHLHASDPNLDPLTYVVVTQPAHGTLAQDGADVVYTPAANYYGADSFTYKANDGRVDGNTATVSITVNSVNDAPTATKDVLPLSGGGATTINPLANDYDVEGDAFSITSFTQPARGSVVRQGDTFVYTPAKSYQGFDTFTYTITDADGASATGEVAVASGVAVLDGDWTTYGGSAAHAGAFAGFVGAAEPIDGWTTSAGTGAGPVAVGGGRVYVTSQDAAGMRLRALDPASGQVLWTHTFAAGNSLNPPTYYNGRVYLQRGNHSSDTQLFAIDAATGDTIWSAPFQAQWESYYAPAVNDGGIWINGGYYGGMYGFRHDGSQIAFVSLAQYDDWSPSILGDSIYSYVEGKLSKYSSNGSLQWTHTKTWNWAGWSMNTLSALSGNRGFVNGQPNLYAVNLDTGTTAWTVTGNFSGTPAVAGNVVYAISGNNLNAYSVADGSLVKSYAADTALQQQPIVTDDAIFVASGSKTYIFNRATGALAYTLPYGGTIALATNRLYVNTPGGLLRTYAFARSDNAWPVAAPDAATTAEDTAVDVNVTGNDSDPDGDPVKLRAVGTPAHGTATLVGTDSVHYVPAKDFFGTDSFTYTVVDEKGGRATGTVTVTVTPVDDPPVAKPVTIYVPTTGPTPIILGGTDIDGDALTVEITAPPLQGTLGKPDADGKVLYTPRPGFTGSDSFYYVVKDATNRSAEALVTVYVDDAPAAVDGSAVAREDVASSIALGGTDPNGDPLTYKIVSGPLHGSATINGRFLNYTPALNYYGPDRVTFKVNDGIMDSANVATLTIDVQNKNDAPVGNADAFAAPPGQRVVSPDLLMNDTDVDNDPLRITAFTQAAHGVVSLLDNGRVTYQSAAGYQGLDQFTYTVSDGQDGASTTTVSISVGTPALAGDWTTFGNNPAHTGYFAGTLLGGALVQKWNVVVPGTQALNQLAVADGRVYLTPYTYFGDTYAAALDASTGQQVWKHTFTSAYSINPPTYANGRVYLQRGDHSSDSQLWALDAATGNTAWSAPFQAQWERYMAPVVADGGIFVNGGYYGGLYGFNQSDGSQRFFVGKSQVDGWTPTYADGKLYTSVGGVFAQHNPTSGAVDWSITLSAATVSSIADGRAYLTGSALTAVDLATHAVAWQATGSFTGVPAVARGVVYTVSGSQVKAFDARTGAAGPTFTAGESISSQQPIVTDDALIVSSATATYVFNLGTGELMQRLARAGTLTLANGTLYVAGTGGSITAYGLATPAAAPSRPDLAAASDTGRSDADDLTGDTTPTFTGTAAPGAAVTLYDGSRAVGSAQADASGAWSITPTAPLADGVHHLAAAVLDLNAAAALSAPLQVTVDASAPTATADYTRGVRVNGVVTNTLTVRFSDDAEFPATAAATGEVGVRNLTTGQDLVAATSAFDAASRTLVVSFPAAGVPDGNYVLTVPASTVTDAAGNALDGDADGQPGGDLAVPFFELTGDANRDRIVNFADLLLLAKNYNATGPAVTWGSGDFDFSGTVNFTDLLALAKNYNKALPAPPPGAPAVGALVPVGSSAMPSLSDVLAEADDTTAAAMPAAPVPPAAAPGLRPEPLPPKPASNPSDAQPAGAKASAATAIPPAKVTTRPAAVAPPVFSAKKIRNQVSELLA